MGGGTPALARGRQANFERYVQWSPEGETEVFLGEGSVCERHLLYRTWVPEPCHRVEVADCALRASWMVTTATWSAASS